MIEAPDPSIDRTWFGVRTPGQRWSKLEPKTWSMGGIIRRLVPKDRELLAQHQNLRIFERDTRPSR
jgi:hypothetical protein